MNFSLTKKTKIDLPVVSWIKIKEKILGKKYNLSLVFIGEKLMAKLHKKYLKKSGATTVLSFSFSKLNGEIFLCPKFIKKYAKLYKINYGKCVEKIFIHGMLHLKGFEHGAKMEKEENKLLKLT